jgi:hypothetical protein
VVIADDGDVSRVTFLSEEAHMQPTRFRYVVVGLGVSLGAASGCDSSPTEPDPANAQIAMAFAAMTATAPVSNTDDQFVLACPAGGSLIIDGTTTLDIQDNVTVSTWDHTSVYDDCAIDHNGRIVTANGQIELEGEARFGGSVNQLRQLTYQQSSQTGSMTIVVDGRSSTCMYDMHHEFEPTGNTYHITGTACGRAVDMRLSLEGPGG